MTFHPAQPQGALTLDAPGLDRLMPMHLRLDGQGCIRSVGPTLVKLLPQGSVLDQHVATLFALRRPSLPTSLAALQARVGCRIHLALLPAEDLTLRGLAVPTGDGGLLINLSFGIGVTDAVRRHALTVADFAATDLTIEMLYLVEAKSAVMDELRNLNLRLHGAKLAAEEQALTDTLTGLRNRRALDLRLGHLLGHGQPFALMHLDLDFFKQVNDSLGHAAGDHVLRQVALTLMDEIRSTDLVARVGGDEFVIVFSGNPDIARLTLIANRIIARLSEPMDFEGKACRISASAGLALSTFYTAPDAPTMQADADAALYASKHAGRGQARIFTPADQLSA